MVTPDKSLAAFTRVMSDGLVIMIRANLLNKLCGRHSSKYFVCVNSLILKTTFWVR